MVIAAHPLVIVLDDLLYPWNLSVLSKFE